jgi:SUKH-4 immunity protein
VTGSGGVRKYLKIGTDYGYDVGIVADTGEVLTLSSTDHYPSRFVNSSLEYFIDFLCRVISARRRFHGRDFTETAPLVKDLEAELRARDPRAFSAPEHW